MSRNSCLKRENIYKHIQSRQAPTSPTSKLTPSVVRKMCINIGKCSCCDEKIENNLNTINMINVIKNKLVKINIPDTDTILNGKNENDINNEYYYRHRERKLEYQKKYNRENDEKIKEYNKDYYQIQREKILEKAKTKIICDCGCEVHLSNLNAHKKTKKHIRLLKLVIK